MSNKLRRGAYCSDIHFGRKSNAQVHNEDCINFLTWFCKQVKDNDCDYVAFLGDWNENRSALNIATLNYSYMGAKMLNDLGIPVYFCVGNHDLYNKHNRDLYSVVPFKEFTNFVVVDKPTIVDTITDRVLFSPFLFHDEYPQLKQYLEIPVWGGHFEFSGFQITGYNMKMQHGADPSVFKGPKHILSGHFHKRQQGGNIAYIGNCFPMDYGDAGDVDRGMAIYHHDDHSIDYINWTDCPQYRSINLSDLLDSKVDLAPNTRVHCIMDIDISYQESNNIKQQLTDQFQLREFVALEPVSIDESLSDTDAVVTDDKTKTVDDLVIEMLQQINNDQISNDLLVKIYMDIKEC